jgi:hypothetical protein
VLALVLVQGCHSLTPAGANVQLVSAADVSACKPLGAVSSSPPYGTPDDYKIQLRNEAAKLGGNRVVSEAPGIGSVTGNAYSCAP